MAIRKSSDSLISNSKRSFTSNNYNNRMRSPKSCFLLRMSRKMHKFKRDRGSNCKLSRT